MLIAAVKLSATVDDAHLYVDGGISTAKQRLTIKNSKLQHIENTRPLAQLGDHQWALRRFVINVTALKSTRHFWWMGKPCNCFHLQRMWGLKQSYHGTDTKERTGSFNTITFMTAHGNSLNHSFCESSVGHWSCSTKLTYGGINVKRQPPVRGNYRFELPETRTRYENFLV